MISIDKKVAKAALKLTKKYDDSLIFLPGQSLISLTHLMEPTEQSAKISVDPDEIPPAIDRLSASGYFKIRQRTFGGAVFFSIQPRLRHRFAFFMDAFTKKFWSGFLTGVAVTLTVNLLSEPIRSALSTLFHMLSLLL